MAGNNECPRCLAFRNGTEFDEAAKIEHAATCPMSVKFDHETFERLFDPKEEAAALREVMVRMDVTHEEVLTRLQKEITELRNLLTDAETERDMNVAEVGRLNARLAAVKTVIDEADKSWTPPTIVMLMARVRKAMET